LKKSFGDDFKSIKGRLQSKVDRDLIDEYTKHLDQIAKQLQMKMEKKDLEKTAAQFRYKLTELSNKLIQAYEEKGDNSEPYPLFMYNNKCIFCNQGVKMGPNSKRAVGSRYSYVTPLREYKVPKYGGGFSKLLSSCKNDKDFHQLLPNTSKETSRPFSINATKTPVNERAYLAPVFTPNKHK
jgi:hypothetical protein